jgi:hypothetical protein
MSPALGRTLCGRCRRCPTSRGLCVGVDVFGVHLEGLHVGTDVEHVPPRGDSVSMSITASRGLWVDVNVGGVLGIPETPSAPVSTVALVLKRRGHDVAKEAPRAVLGQ